MKTLTSEIQKLFSEKFTGHPSRKYENHINDGGDS